MLSMFVFFMVVVLILVILLSLNYLNYSYNKSMNMISSASFECGFDPLSSFRKPFSFRFFYLLLIFLLFDSEIILLSMSNMSLFYMNYLNYLLMFIILSIFMWSLYFEKKMGLLKWSY